VLDVVPPGLRATGVSLFVVVQNLFGLAIGPVLTGALADRWGLGSALSVVAGLGGPAALALYSGSRSYRRDRNQAASPPPGRLREGAGAGSDSSEPTGVLDVDAGDAAGCPSTRAQPLPTPGITPGDAAVGAPPRPGISAQEG
jgi:MFS family permease